MFLLLYKCTVLVTIIGLIVMSGSAAFAQTKLTKDFANNFYNRCTESQDPRMSKDTQVEFCACTSASLLQKMNAEDVDMVGEDTAQGHRMYNKMMVTVYAPCMDSAVGDMAFAGCVRDPRTAMADQTLDRKQLCRCMRDRTREWFNITGSESMMRILEGKTDNAGDPLSIVMNSELYKKETYEIMMGCITEMQNNGGKRGHYVQ